MFTAAQKAEYEEAHSKLKQLHPNASTMMIGLNNTLRVNRPALVLRERSVDTSTVQSMVVYYNTATPSTRVIELDIIAPCKICTCNEISIFTYHSGQCDAQPAALVEPAAVVNTFGQAQAAFDRVEEEMKKLQAQRDAKQAEYSRMGDQAPGWRNCRAELDQLDDRLKLLYPYSRAYQCGRIINNTMDFARHMEFPLVNPYIHKQLDVMLGHPADDAASASASASAAATATATVTPFITKQTKEDRRALWEWGQQTISQVVESKRNTAAATTATTVTTPFITKQQFEDAKLSAAEERKQQFAKGVARCIAKAKELIKVAMQKAARMQVSEFTIDADDMKEDCKQVQQEAFCAIQQELQGEFTMKMNIRYNYWDFKPV